LPSESRFLSILRIACVPEIVAGLAGGKASSERPDPAIERGDGALSDCSRRGDLVLDSFGGSGTTLIACERTNRQARLIELDPIYCDQIVQRWQKLTGRKAVQAVTGVAFDHANRSHNADGRS